MADTPVLELSGIVGMVNAGVGGGSLKTAAGSTYVSQYANQLLVTIDFVPLMIFTNTGNMYSSTGTLNTVNGYHISYRASKDDAWQSSTSNRYTHSYNEATGEIRVSPDTTSSRGSTIKYVVMGV